MVRSVAFPELGSDEFMTEKVYSKLIVDVPRLSGTLVELRDTEGTLVDCNYLELHNITPDSGSGDGGGIFIETETLAAVTLTDSIYSYPRAMIADPSGPGLCGKGTPNPAQATGESSIPIVMELEGHKVNTVRIWRSGGGPGYGTHVTLVYGVRETSPKFTLENVGN